MMHPLQQEKRRQGCPNLDAQGVVAGPHKSFHLQILLQGLEKQLSGKGLARG
jgi:hypothetical protein